LRAIVETGFPSNTRAAHYRPRQIQGLASQLERTRFNLAQIENLVDQFQQVQ